MDGVASAALGIAIVALMFVRSLRRQVHELSARMEDLESELCASAIEDPGA